MKASEENPFAKRFRDYSLRLHMQRLEEIKTRNSSRIDNSCPLTKSIIGPINEAKKFSKKSKIEEISRENSKFSEILHEVSNGKRETITQRILNSSKDPPVKKSLNRTTRKKEATRINESNEEIIRRIQKVSPDLSFNKFKQEYAIISKYKETIARKTPRYSSNDYTSTLILPNLDISGAEKHKKGGSANATGRKRRNFNKTQGFGEERKNSFKGFVQENGKLSSELAAETGEYKETEEVEEENDDGDVKNDWDAKKKTLKKCKCRKL